MVLIAAIILCGIFLYPITETKLLSDNPMVPSLFLHEGRDLILNFNPRLELFSCSTHKSLTFKIAQITIFQSLLQTKSAVNPLLAVFTATILFFSYFYRRTQIKTKDDPDSILSSVFC
jgi:hypothetical protein